MSPVNIREQLREQIRLERPGIAKKADKGTSALSAVRLFCVECMGGQQAEVRRCETRRCFLHPYRMGKNTRKRTTSGL